MSSAGSIDARRTDAQRLRAGGATYDEIAEALGVSHATAYSLLNPEYYARHLVTAVAWKDHNREANRARDRDRLTRLRVGKEPCKCGRAFIEPERAQCGRCDATDRAGALRQQIHDLWHADATIPGIAAATGKSKGYITGTIAAMRATGWEMPHRYRRSEAA